MKKIRILFTAALCLLTFATTVPAAPEKWEIDKDHTSIYFDIKHTYATVQGLFDDFSGTLILDPDDPGASRVSFTVNVDSIDTNIAQRDDHLRSDDFFSASTFPEMTFKSTKVALVKGNQYVVTGNLTVKDVTKTIDVPFTYYGMKENPLKKGQMVAGFEAEFTIDRLDYHVGTGKFADMGVVGREVRIVVALEALNMKN